MKKALLIALLTLFSIFCSGQDGGPLKFLGIPIDGPEAQFVAKLKAKGFTYNSVYNCYHGQFNGESVNISLHTNHNMLDRVYVAFPYTTEDNIRVEFNRLLAQFKDSSKYMDFSRNEEIPENDDISYEITVNNKRYQASFSYIDMDSDPVAFLNRFLDLFKDLFTEEQLTRLKEYIKKASDATQEQREVIQNEMMEEMQKIMQEQQENAEPNPEKALRFVATFFDGLRSMADGEVWFMIHERYGRYNIGLYYDNLHNQAHGEDL
ncbi:MAG: hypothetical protein IKR69_02010 [Bacteroidales bacterium]|nr:hypothetical protein [Bacteroidales bacterium]